MTTSLGSVGSSWLDCARRGDLGGLQRILLRASAADRRSYVAHQMSASGSVGNTALHWLAAIGHEDGVLWLLTLPATEMSAPRDGPAYPGWIIATTNHGGSTALHTACANGHAVIVSLLMRHGGAACAVMADSDGDTPVTAAARRAHAEAALALLTAPAMLCAPRPPPHIFLQVTVAGKLLGDLIFQLDADATPRAAANLIGLTEGVPGLGSYCGTQFHRLLPGQIVQGGRLKRGKLSIFGGYFEDEPAGLARSQDGRGLLAMANAGPHSNGCEFYITLGECTHLDGKHVVVGWLVAGHDALQVIASVPASERDKPLAPIVIEACGRWPPLTSSGDTVALPAAEASAAAHEASQEALHSASEAKRAAVASVVAEGLKRSQLEPRCAERPAKRGAVPAGSMWALPFADELGSGSESSDA